MEGAEQKVGPSCEGDLQLDLLHARLDDAAGKAATRLIHTPWAATADGARSATRTLRSPPRPKRTPLDDGAARRGAMSSPVRTDTLGYSAALEGAPPASTSSTTASTRARLRY